MSLYTIKAVMILDSNGSRIVAKYYDDRFPSVPAQNKFEKELFEQTSKLQSEILMYQGYTVTYKLAEDLYYYVIGGPDENELLLHSVLSTLQDAVAMVLHGQMDKRNVLDNLDVVLLAVDELIDGGIILESDATIISNRVSLRASDGEALGGEQNFSLSLAQARDHLTRALLK